MKTLLPLKDWLVDPRGDHTVVGMFSDGGTVIWEKLNTSTLPDDLVRLKDGKGFVVVGGVEVEAASCSYSPSAAPDDSGVSADTMN